MPIGAKKMYELQFFEKILVKRKQMCYDIRMR